VDHVALGDMRTTRGDRTTSGRFYSRQARRGGRRGQTPLTEYVREFRLKNRREGDDRVVRAFHCTAG